MTRLGHVVEVDHTTLLVPSPFNRAEGDSAEDVQDDRDEELPVEFEDGGIPEGDGLGQGLHELEDCEGRGRVVFEGTSKDGKQLKILNRLHFHLFSKII